MEVQDIGRDFGRGRSYIREGNIIFRVDFGGRVAALADDTWSRIGDHLGPILDRLEHRRDGEGVAVSLFEAPPPADTAAVDQHHRPGHRSARNRRRKTGG